MVGGPSTIDRHQPLRPVLHRRVVEQAEALLQAEQAIRRGDASGTHDARVASRRLRAVLSTFHVAFRTEGSEPLRAELGWLARSLGGARDLHVARARLLTLSEAEEVRGPMLERVRAGDWHRSADSEQEPLAVVDSHRHRVLLEQMTGFVSEPPWTHDAERPARALVRKAINQEWQRLVRRVARVPDLEPESAFEERLHDVRKAAKRTRYALEVAETLWRSKPKRLRKHVHRLTDILGEHQDVTVTRTALRELAAQAESVGEPTFTHRRLDRAEEVRANELIAEFRRAWSVAQQQREVWP